MYKKYFAHFDPRMAVCRGWKWSSHTADTRHVLQPSWAGGTVYGWLFLYTCPTCYVIFLEYIFSLTGNII